jgi:ribosomal protein S18 acetylase RimI-like enzyme
MAQALQLEVLDLRHFAANSLRPVLEEESRVWGQRLRWDYRTSADLLLQYLDSRVLPGYVALENGRVAGYVFCVYEDTKAVIGDVFAIPPRNGGPSAHDIESRLLAHLIELLKNSPGVDRIESQLLLHPHGEHAEVFRQNGFHIHCRLFMELDLDRGLGPDMLDAHSIPLPPGTVLRPWAEADFTPAGRLIADSYAGHLDSQINNQYRSISGSLRFLHNIVRFPGCGVFDPAASRVIAWRNSDEIAALLLCSRVRDDVGHVTQICVARQLRGRGYGKLLLKRCAGELERRGFKALTLTVTEENSNAVALYRACGFEDRHSFDAMVWDRRERPTRVR